MSFLNHLKGRLNYFFGLPGYKKQPVLTLWRAISWRTRCFLRIPTIFTIPAWGSKFFLAPEWHGAGTTLFYVVRELYEPELTFLEKFLRPGETFVDAGANCGVYTVNAARIVGDKGRVLSFEPGSEVYRMLQNNIDINGFKQARAFKLGLSNSSGTVPLYSHPHGASSASLGPVEGGAGESCAIEVIPLDAVLAAQKVGEVHCIKMDVEGAEELILQGAVKLFERCKPKVIFEINPSAIASLNLQFDGVWRFLDDRGYRFFSIDLQGELTALSACPHGGNIIALPK